MREGGREGGGLEAEVREGEGGQGGEEGRAEGGFAWRAAVCSAAVPFSVVASTTAVSRVGGAAASLAASRSIRTPRT